MLGNESFMLISMLRTKVPADECSRERKFQGTKVSPMELLFPGTKVLGYESSSYQSMQKLFGKLKHFSHSRHYHKCSGQELDLLMAMLKVGLSKADKCHIGTISVVWNLGGLLINFANKQCLK